MLKLTIIDKNNNESDNIELGTILELFGFNEVLS